MDKIITYRERSEKTGKSVPQLLFEDDMTNYKIYKNKRISIYSSSGKQIYWEDMENQIFIFSMYNDNNDLIYKINNEDDWIKIDYDEKGEPFYAIDSDGNEVDLGGYEKEVDKFGDWTIEYMTEDEQTIRASSEGYIFLGDNQEFAMSSIYESF